MEKLIRCKVCHPYKPFNVGDIGDFPESEVKRVPHALKPVDSLKEDLKAQAVAELQKKNADQHEAMRESFRAQHEAAVRARAIRAHQIAEEARIASLEAQKALDQLDAAKVPPKKVK